MTKAIATMSLCKLHKLIVDFVLSEVLEVFQSVLLVNYQSE